MSAPRCVNCRRREAGADGHCMWCRDIYRRLLKARESTALTRIGVLGIATAIVELRASGENFKRSLDALAEAVALNKDAIAAEAKEQNAYDRANPMHGVSI